jgi:hypothetical protein
MSVQYYLLLNVYKNYLSLISYIFFFKDDNGEIQLDKEEFEILDQRNKSLSFTYSEKL